MRSTLGAIGWLALILLGACTPAQTLSTGELRERAAVARCEQPRPGHVVYAGESPKLADCLASLKLSEIDELRISSRGGPADATLDLARRLADKVDSVIVDGLCASSCANYLLPIAKRLVVEPGSLVLLHGSIDVEQVSEYLDKNRDALRDQASGASAADVDKALERLLAETRRDAMEQAQFEDDRLSCRDWLDPDLQFPPGEVPERLEYLVVTKAMAERCLKQTRVERFWEPSPRQRQNLAAEGLVAAKG